MNERIEEFAKDCEILGEKEFAGKVVGFNYAKFAELIVQEAIEACEKNSMLDLDAWQRSEQIKKHFGVEE